MLGGALKVTQGLKDTLGLSLQIDRGTHGSAWVAEGQGTSQLTGAEGAWGGEGLRQYPSPQHRTHRGISTLGPATHPCSWAGGLLMHLATCTGV